MRRTEWITFHPKSELPFKEGEGLAEYVLRAREHFAPDARLSGVRLDVEVAPVQQVGRRLPDYAVTEEQVTLEVYRDTKEGDRP